MQYISQLFISRQRYDDARTLLLGLLRGAPPESDLHYLLGVIYDKQQQPNEALRQFSEVAEDSAFYTSAMMQMAFLYEETEQPDKTKALFDRLLEEEPDNIELLLYAGSFLERQEQYKQAEALYLRGIEIEPRNVDLLFRLGVVYDKTGRKEAVIKQMKDILEIAPDDANALNYLGYTYADMGINLDEARQLIEKALQIEPDNGYITDSLGWVYYQKGDYDKAIALLIRAVELNLPRKKAGIKSTIRFRNCFSRLTSHEKQAFLFRPAGHYNGNDRLCPIHQTGKIRHFSCRRTA